MAVTGIVIAGRDVMLRSCLDQSRAAARLLGRPGALIVSGFGVDRGG